MARTVTRSFSETDAGLEIQCNKCFEFWPATTEFFFKSRHGTPVGLVKLMHWCRDCLLTYRQERNYGN